jgi:phosphatidylglycerol---prolipoprotein diacylglyceryl transferase
LIEIGIDPVVSIGPIAIRWYGIFVALAVMTVVAWAVVQVRRKKVLPIDVAFTAALVGIPSGIIFSRLLHVIDDWGYYFANPGKIIGGSGLTAWGAVLGAAIGIWVYSKISKFKFGIFADLIAPGIILGQAVGRIGCILNGCCYGTGSDLPWAFIYTHPDSFGPIGIPTHPAPLYELVYNLIVFGILFKLRGRFKPDGSLFYIYLSLYSVWRLGIDFLREGTPFLIGLHQAQVISIIILLITIPNLVLKTRWVKAQTEAKADAGE